MMATTPYRLQIFIPEDMREAMRDIAHREKTSLQQLTVELWREKLAQYPEYAHYKEPSQERG